MTWKEVKVEEQRLYFIEEYLKASLSLTELCIAFNISRKTGHKWIKRYHHKGKRGLCDLSRAPHTNPRALQESVIEKILEVKAKYSSWGAKKIHAWIKTHCSHMHCPSINSIGNILSRFGLTTPRRYRRHVPKTAPLKHCLEANNTWMYDFKGWFLTEDGVKCEPLTITDGHTRYLLKCVPLKRKTVENVWSIFERAFKEFGLPLRMRSDNGPPFATTGAGRLSRLSILLIKAGVTPEWITPGKPQENGRHERFHLTLKKETASPPARNLRAQVERFKSFQNYYNNERPHESLNQKTPASLYQSSKRTWDGVLRPPDLLPINWSI